MREYPTDTQRANCIRLADELDEVSQNVYMKIYRGDPIIYLIEQTVGIDYDLRNLWYKRTESDFYDFDIRMEEIFFDPNYIFYNSICVQRNLVTMRLRNIANLHKKKTLFQRFVSIFRIEPKKPQSN